MWFCLIFDDFGRTMDTIWTPKILEVCQNDRYIFMSCCPVGLVPKTAENQENWIIVRGTDRLQLFDYFLTGKLRYIIRLKSDRNLIKGGKSLPARKIAGRYPVPYAEVTITRKSPLRNALRSRLAFVGCGCRTHRCYNG